MVLYHKPVKKKTSGSGGKRRAYRDKRLIHYGGFQVSPKVSKTGEKEQRETRRTKGGHLKIRQKIVEYAVLVYKGKAKKVRIINVVETPSNRNYARENILVKGAIIETEEGRARVANRPGQTGVVNAVPITDQKV
ncbi:30S ribosomal protein S8e [Candidatus Micrarchaeota archaeon]|nr:30S ribosomal protein S8e [Candidatus Micrarchaeota archaeon]